MNGWAAQIALLALLVLGCAIVMVVGSHRIDIERDRTSPMLRR